MGVDLAMVKGKRWFRNYPTAEEAREAVSDATYKRVMSGKTIALCPFSRERKGELTQLADDWRVFPLGAVDKPLEPGVKRLISDHTRSGLKAATNMEFFRHTLRTYEEISDFLKYGYSMRMSDVDGAFPLLPLACRLWPLFMFSWYGLTDGMLALGQTWLFMHVCGDFGAAGLPGTWKIFFSDVMMGVARSEGVLTLACPVYVDDLSLIGARAGWRSRHSLVD